MKAQSLLQQMKDQVATLGPCVLEQVTCFACGHKEMAFHPFLESLNCAECGHRNASKIAIYECPGEAE